MRTIKSFKYALNGLKTVWKEEVNFRLEAFLGALVILSIFYFDFNYIESALLVFAVTLVLVSEIINTIVEDLCNKIQPNNDQVIAKIKDLAAAFVLISSICSVVIAIFVLKNYFI